MQIIFETINEGQSSTESVSGFQVAYLIIINNKRASAKSSVVSPSPLSVSVCPTCEFVAVRLCVRIIICILHIHIGISIPMEDTLVAQQVKLSKEGRSICLLLFVFSFQDIVILEREYFIVLSRAINV